MCRSHAAVRSLLGHIVAESRRWTVVDMEAGLEHLSRGTPRHADAMLVVVEPYYKSLETGARIQALAKELGIGRVYAVANKIRDSGDQQAIIEFCRRHELPVIATIPHDQKAIEAERVGIGPMDYDPTSPSVTEIVRLADRLLES